MSKDFAKIKCEFDKDNEGTLTCSVSIADGEKETMSIGKIEDEHIESFTKELIKSGVLMVQTALLKRLLAEMRAKYSPIRTIKGSLIRLFLPLALIIGLNSVYIFHSNFWSLIATFFSAFVLTVLTSAGLKHL